MKQTNIKRNNKHNLRTLYHCLVVNFDICLPFELRGHFFADCNWHSNCQHKLTSYEALLQCHTLKYKCCIVSNTKGQMADDCESMLKY